MNDTHESTQPPLVQLTDVVKSYNQTTPVLAGVNLNVRAGEALAMTGPSGSGKTTLLNLIGCLDTPDSGRIVVAGLDVATLDETAAAAFRRATVGFVFQLHHLLPQLTAYENVVLPTLAGGQRNDTEAPSRAMALLDRVGLADRRDHRPGEMSGGQLQRVAIARALINQPTLLLADEPTGSLDRHTAEEVVALLLELNADDDVTLIVATHDLSLASQMRRQIVVTEGRIDETDLHAESN